MSVRRERSADDRSCQLEDHTAKHSESCTAIFPCAPPELVPGDHRFVRHTPCDRLEPGCSFHMLAVSLLQDWNLSTRFVDASRLAEMWWE